MVIFSMSSTLKPAQSEFVNCFEIFKRFVICNNYNLQSHLLSESHLPLQKNRVYATSHSVVNVSPYKCFFSPQRCEHFSGM